MRRFRHHNSGRFGRNAPYISVCLSTPPCPTRRTAINDDQKDDEERPCLHCLIVGTIDSFFADYPVSEEEPDAIDTGEVVTALAKIVAEMTCSMDGAGRQKMIEQLMQEAVSYDTEFRQQDQLGTAASGARH